MGQVELDDQALAGAAGGILGTVQHIGPQAHDVKHLKIIGLAFHKMLRIGTKHHAQFIKRVEMLELHIDIGGTHIVIKVIKQAVSFLIDADVILVLIKDQIFDQHDCSPPSMLSARHSSSMQSCAGKSDYQLVEHVVLHHEDLYAVNTEAAPATVAPSLCTTSRIENGNLHAVLQEKSWNMLRMKRKA